MPKQEPRLYVILREDLAYKYIQGEHVVGLYAHKHPEVEIDWNNVYLINLSVFNGLALREVLNDLKADVDGLIGDAPYSVFYEPDLESPLPTAIAIYENGDGGVAKALSHLRLSSK